MLHCSIRFGKKFLCFALGNGLGSRLFPWARCRIFSKIHNGVVITPIWARPAIGQLIRGGVDYQSYLRQIALWGLFQKRKEDIGLLRAYFKTYRMPCIDEPNDLHHFSPTIKNSKMIFQYKISDNFQPLNGWSEFLHDELRTITKPKYLALADKQKSIPIGIVVRCGNDYDEPPSDRALLKPGEKTPIRWFVNMLKMIRTEMGADIDAYIVSDGTKKQLAELLALKNTHFVRPGSAISDLLTIARAKILIAAGTSTFSAWASFFGQMPSASHPGQPLTSWGLVPERHQFIGEVDPQNPTPEFINQVKQALAPYAV